MAERLLILPAHDRPVILEVSIGPLPAGAELVLETLDGAYVGAVGFFGGAPEPAAGAPQIAVPRDGLPKGPATVVGRVLLPDGAERPATEDELRALRIVSD
ncbi:MAG: hypothetical protein QNJ44_12315 [Rhodobacter sp.]|nr:hypothetical protein [Rhodobacter sp.]